MTTRIGVDCGGTFTDLVFYDSDSAETQISKVPSTPGSLEAGVLNAVTSLGPRALTSARLFLHGNTVALNALLERKGARVGLLTTKGFRDTLEIRRGDRAKLYDPMWKPPPPLVPRRLRRPIHERIRSDGSVETPLSEPDVLDALQLFECENVDCIAVVFLH
jgi:N-methylhydantoinase A